LLAHSDVISLHVPGGEATRHMIDAGHLALMKSDAILVNTARGTVIDEAALAQALGEGRIAAAGLDVYEREPAVHPDLLACDNAVLLPHLGSATVETRCAMGHKVIDNLDAFFAGQPLPDPVVMPSAKGAGLTSSENPSHSQ
jgi:lactate dehydrogenase-like 2-hydroxyacid dehydrogenase